MSIEKYMEEIFANAKLASQKLLLLNTEEKNVILNKMADAIDSNAKAIIEANSKDVEDAKSKMTEAELDRLRLTKERVKSIANDIRTIADLKDPIGDEEGWTVSNGLKIRKVRVPFGVIGAIYESRPNVTADIAALCIKSGNAAVLRGSSNALNSNRAIMEAIKIAVPQFAVQFVDTSDRSAVELMMKARGKLDLLIPRGGAGLIRRTVEESRVPVIETGTGNCHVFVDESADLEQAIQIIINSKCQRPGTCNSEEKLLIHKKVADRFVPMIAKALREKGVELRACPLTRMILQDAKPATEADWGTEYLDLIIAIKIVQDVNEAISHINKYNSKHTEAILTNNYQNAERFAKLIDAAAINVNASTRFTDGGQYGFGAEVGISTQKLHARGPMGLAELTTYKYVVSGNGQIRN
ncbi:glutamate-5-semialdehyde dehydrogenase [Candidatus Micrarchaeota archaeon]|nr:glutamate-5-semialdehyde dehydrogenase [Candidatus Micrarchaeota archaeon]